MTGRPTDFCQETADLICEHLADGVSLKQICAPEDRPARSTVYRWLAADEPFRDMYARAREDQADTLADEIMAIADDATDPQKARLQVDARKWVAAKLKPRKYGDKLAVGGAEDLPPIKTEADVIVRPQITREEWIALHVDTPARTAASGD